MNKLIFVAVLMFLNEPLVHGLSEAEAISDVDFTHLQTAPTLNWGLNPFSRKPGYVKIDPSVDEISPEQFHLGGIIYDKEDPVAIINGETVGIGDEIGDLKIETIAPNYVVIRGEGNRFELSLRPAKEAKHRAEIRPYRVPAGESAQ